MALLLPAPVIRVNSLICFCFCRLCGFDPYVNQIHTKRRGGKFPSSPEKELVLMNIKKTITNMLIFISIT